MIHKKDIKTPTELTELAEQLNVLNKDGFLGVINKTARIFSNYEFIIEVETKDDIIFDYKVDFVPGVVPFSFPDPATEQLNFEGRRYTIARIDKSGFKTFPEEVAVADVSRKKSTEVNLHGSSQDQFSVELDPSKFYFHNELIAEILSGGQWAENFGELAANLNVAWFEIEEYDIEYYSQLMELGRCLNKTGKISAELYIDAELFYEGVFLKERILQFNDIEAIHCIFFDLINYNLRGFHDGNYCPISKSEYIKSLDYSLPVKEYFKRIIDYIDTLPFTEQKQSTVKHILNEFEKKGFIEENKDNNTIIEGIKNILNEFLPPVEKRLEALASQTKNNFEEVKKSIDTTQLFENKPEYFDKFTKELKGQYIDACRLISNTNLFVKENEDQKCRGIFSEVGIFVNTVLNFVFKRTEERRSVEMANIRDNKKFMEKTTKPDKENIIIYCDEYLRYYNDSKHDKKLPVNYQKTYTFIYDTRNIIEIVMKYAE